MDNSSLIAIGSYTVHDNSGIKNKNSQDQNGIVKLRKDTLNFH